jgi:hypothetical protein
MTHPTHPIARPIPSTHNPQNPHTHRQSLPIRPPKGDGASVSLRISSRALADIERRMGDHDHAVLQCVSELHLVTGHQLARRIWASKSPTDAAARSARRCLNRLEQWRVIDRLDHRIGGVRGGSSSIVYALGPSGRRLLAASGFHARNAGQPGLRHIAHTLAISELLVAAHEASLRGELELIESACEPWSWRGFVGARGRRVMLKPDLFLRIGAGRASADHWWVEVDQATEASATISAKATRYLDYLQTGDEIREHGVFPRVIWTAPSRKRAEQLQAAIAGVAGVPEGLFVVWPYDEVVGRLASEARS